MRLKKSVNILIISFILFAIFDCAFLYMIPAFMTASMQEYLIKKLVKYTTTANIDISMEPIKTYSDFSFQAEANYINLIDENSEIIFSGKDIQLSASVLPLIFKRISAKNFNVKKLQMNIKRYSDGEYNLQKIFKNPKHSNFTFKKLKCNIEDYDISFKDDYNNRQILLQGDYFRVNSFVSSQSLDLETSGTFITEGINKIPFNIKFASSLPIKNNPDLSKSILEGYIENFNLGYFKPYLQEYIEDDIVEADGDMSFEFHTNRNGENEKQFIIKGNIDNLNFDKKSFRGKISSESPVNINLWASYNNKILSINHAGITSKGFDISSEGEILFFENEKPELELNINLEKSKINDIEKIIPAIIIPKDSDHKDAIVKAKKYEIFGNLKGNVLIKGKIPKPNITGYALAENIHLFNENDKSHNGTVDLKFQGNTMMMDIDVNTEDSENTKITGLTYLFNEGINHFEIKTSDNLDFPLAQKIILPIQDVLGFELGPIPMMAIKQGKGEINLKIDGTKEEGSLFGQASFKNGIVGYGGLFGEVTDSQGIVNFNDKEVTYDTNGYYSGYKININGKTIQHGNVEINIGSDAIETADVMTLINNSTVLLEVKQGLSVLKNIEGKAKINLSMRGDITAFQTDGNRNDIRTRGTVYLFNDKCNLTGFDTPLHSIKGIVEFSDKEISFENLRANIENSQVDVDGNILINRETKIPKVDITVRGREINIGDTIKFLAESDMSKRNIQDISNLYALDSKHDLLFKYNAKSIEFDIQKAYAVMNFLSEQNTKSPLNINAGKVVVKDSKVFADEVSADFFNTKATLNGQVTHINTLNPVYNLNIQTKSFDFSNLPDIQNLPIISETTKNIISMFDNFKGFADLDITIKDNNVSGNVNVTTLSFRNKKTHISVIIPQTKFEIKGNRLSSKNLNARVGKTDIKGDIDLSEIGRRNIVNAHLSTKITNDFVEAYINPFLSSSLSVKGDIDLNSEIKGNLEDMKITSKIIFNPDSDIIYLNTNLGNTSIQRELNGTIYIKPENISVKDLKYYLDKKNLAIFNANFKEKNSGYDTDYISFITNESLPVRFLNPIFGQEIFKDGNFSANMKYYKEEETGIPKLQGIIEGKDAKLKLADINADRIKLKAENDTINIDLEGKVSTSDVKMTSSIKNTLNYPINIDSLKIYSSSMNNTELIDSLNSVREEYIKNKQKLGDKTDEQNILNIIKGEVNIDRFDYKNLKFEDINAKYSLDNDNIFEIKDIKAKIQEGTIEAEASFNVNSGDINLNVLFSDVDSNAVAENIFGAKNQLFGTGHGRLVLTTKGLSADKRMKNLGGECYFVIIDGKMPKLGSLEYLLRASNIVKSGISGLTINSMLDLLNFAKTGSFLSINGSFQINNGIVEDINVFSEGTNLSLYMNGKYNISNGEANAEIWGKLSNKLSTLLGPIGNTSLNTFFSLIPGISANENEYKIFNENIEKIPPLEYSNNDYKIFQAIIDGNINNNSDFVKSFKWVE